MLCVCCHQPLREEVLEKSLLLTCSCGGIAALLPVLKKQIDKKYLRQLWYLATHTTKFKSARPCPSCNRPMREVAIAATAIDTCPSCYLVWLDPLEYDELPPTKDEPNKPLSPLAQNDIDALGYEAQENKTALLRIRGIGTVMGTHYEGPRTGIGMINGFLNWFYQYFTNR